MRFITRGSTSAERGYFCDLCSSSKYERHERYLVRVFHIELMRSFFPSICVNSIIYDLSYLRRRLHRGCLRKEKIRAQCSGKLLGVSSLRETCWPGTSPR